MSEHLFLIMYTHSETRKTKKRHPAPHPGKSNKEIAEELNISAETARTHVNRILSKLHVANRVQATLYALREGITSL